MGLIFRQLFDAETGTFSYLLAAAQSREAVLIDPVFEQHARDAALVRELELKLLCTIETHVHADHVTGAWLLKQALGSRIALARAGGAEGADRLLDPGDTIDFGAQRLEVRATPGHTNGCITLVLADHSLAFTGDALLIRGAGRTDFQQGDPHALFRSVREQIFSLPDDCLLHPGHDYSGRCATSVGEEKRHNPRLGLHVREEDFVGYMRHLGLPHPKKIDAAVPANLRCGRPAEGESYPAAPAWGPVIRTYAGVWQVEPEWVYRHLGEVTLVDVRERAEAEASPMGRLPGSTLLPLGEVREHPEAIPRERPVVLICPAGARSAIAATLLEKAGFERVANLRGGLLEWRSLGLPVER